MLTSHPLNRDSSPWEIAGASTEMDTAKFTFSDAFIRSFPHAHSAYPGLEITGAVQQGSQSKQGSNGTGQPVAVKEEEDTGGASLQG